MTEDLRHHRAQVPRMADGWEAVIRFAHTLDGDGSAGSFVKSAEVANAHLSDNLTHLCACLFFEVRRWRHFGEDPDAEAASYIDSILGKISERLSAGENIQSDRMSKEKELDVALGGALRDNVEFRQWLLSKTRFHSESSAELLLVRDNWPWTTVSCRIWNTESQQYEMLTKQSETDILVVFQSARRGRFALHIENKLATGKFEPSQPELYRARALKWAANPKYGDYEEWATVLLAPEVFYQKNTFNAGKFDVFVAHEEIASFLPEFANVP